MYLGPNIKIDFQGDTLLSIFYQHMKMIKKMFLRKKIQNGMFISFTHSHLYLVK